ncbi:MAG: hypothetical protein J3K34DRAFT_433574 [Monoraphidium minutum]|nr:MAG: hypothetical protein J3K34DRAFT_433574 [Monoraphidium minutum]
MHEAMTSKRHPPAAIARNARPDTRWPGRGQSLATKRHLHPCRPAARAPCRARCRNHRAPPAARAAGRAPYDEATASVALCFTHFVTTWHPASRAPWGPQPRAPMLRPVDANGSVSRTAFILLRRCRQPPYPFISHRHCSPPPHRSSPPSGHLVTYSDSLAWRGGGRGRRAGPEPGARGLERPPRPYAQARMLRLLLVRVCLRVCMCVRKIAGG